jgi:hypothetical protein
MEFDKRESNMNNAQFRAAGVEHEQQRPLVADRRRP